MKRLVNYFWLEYDQMEVELNLLPKWRKRGIKFSCFLLSCYIMLTRIAIHTTFPTTFLGVVFESMVCFGFLIIVGSLLLIVTMKTLGKKALIQFDTHQAKFNWKIFIQLFLVVILPLLIALIAYFPGGLDIDNLSQWWQVQNFKFDDWHPVTHSLMIWLLTRVVNHLFFVLFVQLVVYSLSVAALLHTLFSWGLSKTLTFLVAFVIGTNTIVMKLLMYPYKDCALMIVVTILVMFLINIYLSQGQWLNSWLKLSLISIVSSLVILFRHNGLFFIIGMLAGFLIYRLSLKKVLTIGVLTVLIIWGVKGPLYSAIDATKPNNTYEESVGVPMSILTSVYRNNPDALDDDARLFFDDFTGSQNWAAYQSGNYNTIKWSTDNAEKLSHVQPQTLLLWTFHAIQNDTYTSLQSLISLTGFIWDSSGNQPLSLDVRIEQNDYDFEYSNTWYNQLGKGLFTVFEFISRWQLVQLFFYCLGVLQLLLMIGACYAFSRHGKEIWLLVLPSFCYNFGTMLLLSGFIPIAGTDHRYFVFNLVISFPLFLVLLSDQKTEKQVIHVDEQPILSGEEKEMTAE